jgi:predicted MFS family arabinose efflux permease
MGQTTEVSDYDSVLGPRSSAVFLNFILFMYIVNLFIIGNRFSGKRNKLVILLTGTSYALYILMLRKIQDKKQTNILQIIHGFINTLVLVYFVLNK